ncbi:MAG: type II toxin-antitoxin system YoeB family toxin [Candidatus Micrarchaeota archaeon]|nr:type II toxin-antitoxin system YoeB family toxin [Candidatus Micrarchaeota archaeon]
MEIFSTASFDKDFRKATKEEVKRINAIVEGLKASNFIGKPLRHAKNTYSVRIGNKRFVYNIDGSRILLIFFKSREGVYDYLG